MAGSKPVNPNLQTEVLELIRLTSTDLRPGVEASIRKGRDQEEEGSAAYNALQVILDNIAIAREESTPICQDTGTPIFYVYYPVGWSTRELERDIRGAAAAATKASFLRPNAVDPVTGKNTGDNTGSHYPYIHFVEWEQDHLEVELLLKGGGSENCGKQYTLPDAALGAGRDLEGIKKCVVEAVCSAQGFGCAPGIIGVGLGGDRVSSMEEAKHQLFRPLDDTNPDPVLATLEKVLLEKTNLLGIGPMGFGGKTTTLGIKIGKRHRLPASYFVSISYLCWAARQRRLLVKKGEVSYD